MGVFNDGFLFPIHLIGVIIEKFKISKCLNKGKTTFLNGKRTEVVYYRTRGIAIVERPVYIIEY